MKVCTLCRTNKPKSDFSVRKTGRVNSRCRRCEADYQIEYRKSHPETRTRPSQYQRVKGDPEKLAALNAKRRDDWEIKWKFKDRTYFARMKEERTLVWRARNLSRNISKEITVEWLQSTMEAQNGLCALTKRSLDIMTFEVDHIIPKSRGGTHDLSNLRLVTPEANAAKGAMTDEEFLSLCLEVLNAQIPEAIGRAILRVEAAMAAVSLPHAA